MARPKSERIKVLQRLADHREQEAAQKLGQAQQYLDLQQARLEELEQFRQEYTQRFDRDGRTGINGAALQEFQAFLVQLDQIIEQQRQHVELARSESQQQRHHWQERHTTTEIYGKVVDRYQEHEQRQANRQAQREEDDRPSGPRSGNEK
jgi:flagellar FliJ protein